MPNVSINWLGRHTGKDRRTIKKRLDRLPQDLKGKFDSVTALEAIYCGTLTTENGFISTPEAVRLLTIAKKEEIELQMQIVRGQRIPIEDCTTAVNEVFQSLRGIVKANLPVEAANQVFDQMREVTKWLQQKYAEV